MSDLFVSGLQYLVISSEAFIASSPILYTWRALLLRMASISLKGYNFLILWMLCNQDGRTTAIKALELCRQRCTVIYRNAREGDQQQPHDNRTLAKER